MSQLILWICLRKGHRYELIPFIPAKSSEQNETTLKLLNSIQGSDMISPTSFSGFIFTRAIDMDLDPPNPAKSLSNKM